MIVILNRDVKGTGKAGDVVKVSDGYARNMLLPKGYATEATDGNIIIKTKSGEGGRLFGSITSKDIADETKKQTGLTIDKKKIQMKNPIKSIGRFEIDVKLYPEVSGKLTVEVTD